MMPGWTTAALGDVAVIERRGVDPSSIEDDTVYLGLEHIESGGCIIGHSTVGASGVASTKFRFGPEHLLFGKLRPYLGKIAAPDFAGVCSTDILPLRPGRRLDRQYLLHFLRQPSVVSHAASRATGANLPRLSPSELAGFRLPLPPIEEQRRIAAILDHADQLRRRFIERLNALTSLEASVFRDRFAADGAATTVADVADKVRTGPFGSQLLHGEFVDEGVAVLGLDNVVGNRFRWAERRFITHTKYEQLKRYTVHPDDVLISIMGTVGRCVVVPDGIPIAINTKHICAVTPDQTQVLSVFLRAAFLAHPTSRAFIRQQTKGAIMDGLNMGIIKSMPLPLPSIRRQEEYVREVAAIHRERDHAEFELAGAEELVSSLQARAFSGRL
jgi:type I restriction enzyme S subunit